MRKIALSANDAVQDRVQLLGRLEVATERLLDDDTAVLVDALTSASPCDDVVEERSAGSRGRTADAGWPPDASLSFSNVDGSR